jgi:bifunctional DNA primase/polymerase-like protein
MSRSSLLLRDAALGYASRGIPVLPLHYPLLHHGNLQALTGSRQLSPAGGSGCSCRDPGCGQPAKHPLGALVPHGVNDATCNRARILAWWTRHPQANIGLATGHRFDVLDVDGPEGAHAIRQLAATHGLASSGPLVRTGGVVGTTTWPLPAWATFVRPGWSMWIGGAGAAMWSPHLAATAPATTTSGPSTAISMYRWPRSRHCYEPGWNGNGRNDPLIRWSLRPPASNRETATRRRS